MWPNPQFPADLVIYTEETLMENFIFLCSVMSTHNYIFGFVWQISTDFCHIKNCKQRKYVPNSKSDIKSGNNSNNDNVLTLERMHFVKFWF